MTNKTELPTKDFKWDNGILKQRIKVIRHYPEQNRPVGIHYEWHTVRIEFDKEVFLKLQQED